MTRVNVGIHPQRIPNALLLAEHREITRIPNAIRRGASTTNLPTEFRLGKGHVRFFYDKLGYIQRRYLQLYRECRKRGYNVADKREAFDGLPPALFGDYKPTRDDIAVILHRWIQKGYCIVNHSSWVYYGVDLTPYRIVQQHFR